MGFFDKLKQGLKKTKDSMMKQVDNMVKSFRKIDEEFFEELEDVLIMSDVGAQTAHKICEELADRVKSRKVEDPEEITGMLKELLMELMSGAEELRLRTKPSVILVIGVNGVGKTTSIGKMAARLREQGKSVILGAADTFRAAAIDQLQVWADRAGVKMIRAGEGSDPASVVFDTISAAKAAGSDVIICDTAGRLHNKKNLMDELAKINRVIGRELPDSDLEVLLVLDATTGQNAVNQAIQFKEAAGITGIILTKLDGTAKGGVVIAIQDSLGIPVKFVGVGEQLDDMQPFDAKQFVEALFD
ncbi:MAG: signal recognition particle-docking protein FtsY [Oscillospiraceae bacterium]